MIVLHRLGHQAQEFLLNPDLILSVEATPDTVVTLTSGIKVVVAESPYRVAEEVRAWRAAILEDALGGRRIRPRPRAHPARPAAGGSRPAAPDAIRPLAKAAGLGFATGWPPASPDTAPSDARS